MLCFTCEEICFWILDSLIVELFSNDFFKEDSNFFEQEINVILNLGKVFKIFSEENEELIKKFLNISIKVCFRTCFFNILNFQTVYFIWDDIFSKGTVKRKKKKIIKKIVIRIRKSPIDNNKNKS